MTPPSANTLRVILDRNNYLQMHMKILVPMIHQHSARTLRAIPLAMAATLLFSVFSSAETPAPRDARMAWWREARFGMFIHWGLYVIDSTRMAFACCCFEWPCVDRRVCRDLTAADVTPPMDACRIRDFRDVRLHVHGIG
jgi:hypothetical protein